VARFGSDLLRADGSLDRAALGRVVFADPAALRDLETIVHPAVRPRILVAMDDAAADGAEAVVVEAIRLVEGGLAALCDEVWLVDCDPSIQRERLVGRGSTAGDADQRIGAQAGLTDRVAPAATRIIDTSGSEAATRALVVEALESALRTSRAPAAD
jgi:dephospho-CoA kinase